MIDHRKEFENKMSSDFCNSYGACHESSIPSNDSKMVLLKQKILSYKIWYEWCFTCRTHSKNFRSNNSLSNQHDVLEIWY